MRTPSASQMKYVGLVFSAVFGITALIADPTRDGRLTIAGAFLIALVAIGLVTAVVAAGVERREATTQSRIERQWNNVLKERISLLEFLFCADGGFSLSGLRALLDGVELELIAAMQHRQMTFSIERVPSEDPDVVGDCYCAFMNVAGTSALRKERASLCKLVAEDGDLFAEAHSRDRWRDDAERACGCNAIISWGEIGLPDIQTMEDLRDLSVGLKLPAGGKVTYWKPDDSRDTDLHLLVQVGISCAHFHFDIGPAMTGLARHVFASGTEKPFMGGVIEGPSLYECLREQFFEQGGIESDETEPCVDRVISEATLVGLSFRVRLSR